MQRLFLSPPHMSGQEQHYIAQAFESNYIAPIGPMLTRFEAAICEQCEVPFALATTSGTAAIHLALRVIGLQKDDIVLASSFTFIGSVAPILYENATPFFIDSDQKSWNISPTLLKRAIKEAPKKPKALIITHLYGQSCSLEKIVAICKEHNIILIEDAAESLGATYNKKPTGSFGDFGIYSFNGNKLLTTSGGGVLVSHKKEWIDKARFYATQAKDDAPYYEHTEYGYNYRMSNIVAAIGVAQMEVLDERVAQARQVFSWYQDQLKEIDEISFMPELLNTQGNRWLTTLTFAKTDPIQVQIALEDANIESRPLWKPMHLQPLFKEALALENGVSQKLFETGLCLPSGTQILRDDVVRVCDIIKKVLV